MAFKNIKKFRLNFENEVGQSIDEECQMQLDDTTGVFRIRVPDELIDFCKETNELSYHGANTKHHYISSNKLKDCESRMLDIAKEYLTVEVTSDLVLAYRFNSNVSYMLWPDGVITPNGCRLDKDDSCGEWLGGKNRHAASDKNEGAFGIDLEVRILKRTAYKRSKNTRYKFSHNWTDTNVGIILEEDERYACKIHRFVRLGYLLCEELNSCYGDGLRNDIKVLEYNEDVGKFFYEMLIGLCSLSNKFENFFNMDEEKILSHIDSNIKLIE